MKRRIEKLEQLKTDKDLEIEIFIKEDNIYKKWNDEDLKYTEIELDNYINSKLTEKAITRNDIEKRAREIEKRLFGDGGK